MNAQRWAAVAVAAAGVLAGPAAGRAQELLVDPGFETTTAVDVGWPTVAGVWSGEAAAIVSARDGIEPREGARMLKFEYASKDPVPTSMTACEVVQLVDLTPYSDLIGAGDAVAVVSCRFDRVAGDAQTDTQFQMILRAYDGTPADFPYQHRYDLELVGVETNLISDGDPLTWEPADLEVELPPQTDYVAVWVNAVENVYNDETGIEFDGHYADAVSLQVVPEPGGLAVLALGALLQIRRRVRRGRFLPRRRRRRTGPGAPGAGSGGRCPPYRCCSRA